jgi:hypothetical protein
MLQSYVSAQSRLGFPHLLSPLRSSYLFLLLLLLLLLPRYSPPSIIHHITSYHIIFTTTTTITSSHPSSFQTSPPPIHPSQLLKPLYIHPTPDHPHPPPPPYQPIKTPIHLIHSPHLPLHFHFKHHAPETQTSQAELQNRDDGNTYR